MIDFVIWKSLLTSVTLRLVMIKSINHKGLRQLWENGKSSKLPFDQVNKIRQILEIIDSAQAVPQDFEFFRSWKIHPLKGEWKGYWTLQLKRTGALYSGLLARTPLILNILIIIK